MPVFNYSDYSNELREIICSNPIINAVSAASSRCDASSYLDERFSRTPTFPRIRNNSAYAMDVDIVRNTLEGMTQNAVFGDLAVLRERQFGAAARHTTCSNQVADSTASNSAVSTDADMTQNYSIDDIASFLELDDDSVSYILTGIPRNAVSGDLSVMHARQAEVERIKRLVSSKATVRYIMEVK